MKKENLEGILVELSKCLDLKIGLNVFIEWSGSLHPEFALNIWAPDIVDRLHCFEKKLGELGLTLRAQSRTGLWAIMMGGFGLS